MTGKEWRTYIDDLRDGERTAYLRRPAHLTAAYNRERDLMSDYHGREVLELLQNADDHGPKRRTGKVRIDVCDQGLCFANTGRPFPKEGVESLVISHHSSKALDRKRYIGNKGLGFRAILNWTDAPFIFSDNLRLGFSREYAVRWLRNLCASSVAVKTEIGKYAAAGITEPVATLVCPFYLDDADGCETKNDQLYSLARQQHENGYRTVIGLPLRSEALVEVQRQLRELGPESLLFLRSVSELQIHAPDMNTTIRLRRDLGNTISASVNGKHYNRWQVTTQEGQIPRCLVEDRAPSQYFVSVAMPKHGNGPGKLLVYLPTHCDLPLPIVAHATLTTDQSRNHIVWSGANKFVIQKLGELIAMVAAEAARSRSDWRGVEIVTPHGAFDTILERARLQETIYGSLSHFEVIPCLDGRCREPSDAKRLPGLEIHSLLSGSRFAHFSLPVPQELLSAVQRLGLQAITRDELCAKLSSSSGRLSLEARVGLIHALDAARWLTKAPVPDLLVDGENKVITSTSRALLPPGDENDLELPSWVPTRVVNRRLALMVRAALGVASDQELVARLAGYNLGRYALDALASTITSEGNRICRESPDMEIQIRQQVITAIHGLFRAASRRGSVAKPRDLDLPLPSTDGHFVPASTLYFGPGYLKGALCRDLFEAVSPSCFVAEPDAFAIGEPVEEFLVWAGVASRPRLDRVVVSGEEYGGYVKAACFALKGPYLFSPNDFVGSTAQDIYNSSPVVRGASVPDHINAMVSSASTEAILAFLMSDQEMLRLAHSPGEGTLDVIFGQKQTRRELQNQSPIQLAWWFLRNNPWISTQSGSRSKPMDLALGARGSEELLQLLPPPAIDTEKVENFRNHHPPLVDVENVFKLLGVAETVMDLPWESLYSIARGLPRISPDGALARGLYNAMVSKASRESAEPRPHAPSDLHFWGRTQGGYDYFAASELRYNAQFVVPAILAKHMKLLDLPKKLGAQIVASAFGVEPLRRDDLKMMVSSYRPASGADKLIKDIDALRPFALALRWSTDAGAASRRQLKKLKVTICTVIAATAVVAGHEVSLELSSDGEHTLGPDHCLLVFSDEAVAKGLKDARVANHVANFLSAVLETERMPELAQIAAALQYQRRQLLADMLGEPAVDLLERASEALSMPLAETPIHVAGPSTNDPTHLTGASSRETEEVGDGPSDPADAANHGNGTPATAPDPLNLDAAVAAKVDIPVPKDRRTIPLRFNPTRGIVKTPRIPRQVDPQRSQQIAVAFERSQGRYPLEVDSTQGHLGPGCDILSFASKSRLKEFQRTGDGALVMRFIEVKGSTSPKGAVTLYGNELACAERFGDHFYIYRVHEDESRGVAAVVTLQDPLGKPHSTSVEIDPYVPRDGAELWELTSPRSA